MGKLGLTLALLFLSSVALSWASELVASSGEPYAYAIRTEPAPLISLPSESEDTAAAKLPEAKPTIVESNEEVTTVTFRPAELRLDGQPRIPVSFRFPFRHGRPCHHGRRPFKPRSDLPVPARLDEIPYGNDGILAEEVPGSGKEDSLDMPVPAHLGEMISYGNDVILANEVPKMDKKDRLDPTQWPRFHHHHHHHHHHEKGRTLEMIWQGDADHDMDRGMKKFHHGHRHFEMEDDDKREEHEQHHHGRHHHHHHHHHHEDDEDEEEKPGLLMKFRKFLMDRF